MHLGEASTFYKAEVAAVRSLAPKTRYCHLKQRTKNRNRCLISQLEMKRGNEDILSNMALFSFVSPHTKGLFIWYTLIYLTGKKKPQYN